VANDTFEFIIERYKAWYLDQNISVDIFEAVKANKQTDLLDFSKRIKAVQAFLRLPEANSLAAANKRVNNILKKQSEV
ncbi:glycine--tRNA ligase subunit beta, partial [Escherichia coli]|nr:glycine--tRNA ligase subunit beta [Escherichia coli]